LRIGGLNRLIDISDEKQNPNNEYTYQKYKYQNAKGAYIDNLFKYDGKQGFYYLQTNWNNYNKIHWDIVSDRESYICLYAQRFANK
jgi:hypothetical protein